ncbi:unnamed protein product [Microthlaspi erraticum]|uniref:DUF1985 domain-containing protein n=1 Tax=Microthlaspi erraticum TaxID=1685480 RepID=A0A6D2IBT4_9BRAS|nr:unnamed protein product [Microthlaspi erraticum]
MEKPTFLRRLYTRGAEPEAQKNISCSSNDKKLFTAVKQLLSDAEWVTLYNSRVGVFCKFHDLKFEWSSKLVHRMLSYQLECKKKYEIWSAVGDSPMRFSCMSLDVSQVSTTTMWRMFGPSKMELIRACQWATDWPKEDKLKLGYLTIYTGFIAARKKTSHTRVSLVRLVMDEEEFENYLWGHVGFKNLIEAIKEAELWKSGYFLDGLFVVLQVWAYCFMPEFGASPGAPIPDAPNTPLLAYKGIQGLRNIELMILKQVNFDHCIMVERDFVYPKWDEHKEDPLVDNLIRALYGELGQWKRKPEDWNPQGVLVKNSKPAESVKRKRSSDHGDEMQKRLCPESVSLAEDGFSRFHEKLKFLFADGFSKLSADMKLGFEQSDSKFTILTRKVVRIKKPVQTMQVASRHLDPEPEAPKQKNELFGEEGDARAEEKAATPKKDNQEEEAASEEKVADNTAEKAATPKKNKAPARRQRQLAASQRSPFVGDSTVKGIIPNKSQLGFGYKERLAQMKK